MRHRRYGGKVWIALGLTRSPRQLRPLYPGAAPALAPPRLAEAPYKPTRQSIGDEAPGIDGSGGLGRDRTVRQTNQPADFLALVLTGGISRLAS
eukprot:366470-Chlamydomonas_euryale.AAC.6